MNNIEQMPGAEGVSVEAFKNMSPNQRHEFVKVSLSPEQAGAYSEADIDAIVNLTARLLNSELPDTVQSALGLAKELRMDAIKEIGPSAGRVYAKDAEGNVVASGSNKIEAMKKAQEERAI
ncbi:MAG: hypothetical protein KGJ13_00605 [Patescibacteria group bacterium]|nr:hypothetical protein [Patescibacteria group bacterium]